MTMRTKDSYQEHMLGYLVGVQTEIERLERSRQIRRSDLVELYANLDTAQDYLWRVIRASDRDWERFRFVLEANCEDLLRAFYRVVLSSPSQPRWLLE
jgi:hypothetical protein